MTKRIVPETSRVTATWLDNGSGHIRTEYDGERTLLSHINREGSTVDTIRLSERDLLHLFYVLKDLLTYKEGEAS